MKTGFSSFFNGRSGQEKNPHRNQTAWTTGGSLILKPGVKHTKPKMSKVFLKNRQRLFAVNTQSYVHHQVSSTQRIFSFEALGN